MNSRHFSVGDFDCRDGTPYPPEWVDVRLDVLCGVLDAIRDAWGGPLVVMCGYRTPAYNAALVAASAARNGGKSGVAVDSQHMQGTAADVYPLMRSPLRVAHLHDVVKALYARGQISDLGGLGVYPGWIHVDVRSKAGGHLATWDGVP